MDFSRRTLSFAILLLISFASVGPAFAQDSAEEGEKAAATAPAKDPKAPDATKKPPRRVAAAHIVISYQGAPRAFPGITRTKEEARARAEEALKAARAPEAVFKDVVAKFTDDPNGGANGGMIGIMRRRQLSGPFEALGAALFSMEEGQVSDIVESPFGFHVLTRTKIVEFAASHILIQHEESKRSRSSRTKEDARKFAEELSAQAKADGADFAALARKHSDGPSAPKGGSLGIFSAGQMVPPFESALRELKVGEVSGVVETQFGFHIIRRDAIERVGASHILIQYKGSSRADASVTRTKDEAKALAEKLVAQAKAEGADFAALAREHSNGPSGPDGGDLGLFGKGAMTPPFEKAAFALKVGEVSGVVETSFGFHIILRTE